MKAIKVDPYDTIVWLTTSRGEYERKSKRLRGHGSGVDEPVCGLCGADGRNILVGVFSEGINTLAHELTHAMFAICKHNGLKPFEDDEPQAFLMGKLMADCLKAYPEILYQR